MVLIIQARFACVQVNGHDVSEATADEAARAISSASEPIIVEVLRRFAVSGRCRPLPPPPPSRTGAVRAMDSDAGSPTDYVLPAMMITTSTQTDDCTLDDDDVDLVDQLDYCPASDSCQQYAFYQHL